MQPCIEIPNITYHALIIRKYMHVVEESGGYLLVIMECILWGKLTKSHKYVRISMYIICRIFICFPLVVNPLFSSWFSRVAWS